MVTPRRPPCRHAGKSKSAAHASRKTSHSDARAARDQSQPDQQLQRERAENTPATKSSSTAPENTDLPYAKPVPGKAGYVFSPYDKNGGYVDVTGFAPGSKVKDPYSGKSSSFPRAQVAAGEFLHLFNRQKIASASCYSRFFRAPFTRSLVVVSP